MELDLTPSAVNLIYKCLLGRLPESSQIIENILSACPSVDALIRDIKKSKEFSLSGHASYRETVHENYALSNQTLSNESHADENSMSTLFRRLESQWRHLGDSDPYWSVITNEAFKLENYRSSEGQFLQTGYDNLKVVKRFFERNKIEMPQSTCFELGCGVGRITIPLSKIFEEIVAWDVSSGNLNICKRYAMQEGMSNITAQLVQSYNDFLTVPAHDFFFSIIVLQHNPPPLQSYILDKVLSKTRPGGYCLFQIPTHTPNYSFNVKEFISKPPNLMDMHDLPMQTVFSILDSHNFTPIEVLVDNWTGLYGSHTFFAYRRK